MIHLIIAAGLAMQPTLAAYDVADIAAKYGCTPDNASHVSFTCKGGPYRREPNPPPIQFRKTAPSIYEGHVKGVREF